MVHKGMYGYVNLRRYLALGTLLVKLFSVLALLARVCVCYSVDEEEAEHAEVSLTHR
jgi:hypothetical protein